MLTKEELEDMLHILGLDYEAEANQIYVFYVMPDGRVDNFSINVRRGRTMSDSSIVELMRREYPSTRQATVMNVERPGQQPTAAVPTEWVDVTDVCNLLNISVRTLRNWSRKGYLRQHTVGRRVYYSRSEIDRMLEANVRQEGGYIDKTALEALAATGGDVRH